MNNGLVSGNYIKSRDSYSRLLILMNPIKAATSIIHQDRSDLPHHKQFSICKLIINS